MSTGNCKNQHALCAARFVSRHTYFYSDFYEELWCGVVKDKGMECVCKWELDQGEVHPRLTPSAAIEINF